MQLILAKTGSPENQHRTVRRRLSPSFFFVLSLPPYHLKHPQKPLYYTLDTDRAGQDESQDALAVPHLPLAAPTLHPPDSDGDSRDRRGSWRSGVPSGLRATLSRADPGAFFLSPCCISSSSFSSVNWAHDLPVRPRPTVHRRGRRRGSTSSKHLARIAYTCFLQWTNTGRMAFYGAFIHAPLSNRWHSVLARINLTGRSNLSGKIKSEHLSLRRHRETVAAQWAHRFDVEVWDQRY